MYMYVINAVINPLLCGAEGYCTCNSFDSVCVCVCVFVFTNFLQTMSIVKQATSRLQIVQG